LGALAGDLDLPEQPLHLAGLVTERDQRVKCLRARVARNRAPHDGERRSAAVEPVAHLDDQALGRLAADAGDLRQHGNVLLADAAREVAHAHGREDTERDLRPDPADLEQGAKERPLLDGREAVQHVGVLADDEVRVQEHLGAGIRQPEEGRHRGFQLVADAAAFDDEVRRHLAREAAAQGTDHRSRATAAAPARRPARCRRWPWHNAAARASAASGAGSPESPSSDTTMCWTCSLVAAPVPTTASLISRGAYSKTSAQRPKVAQSAA